MFAKLSEMCYKELGEILCEASFSTCIGCKTGICAFGPAGTQPCSAGLDRVSHRRVCATFVATKTDHAEVFATAHLPLPDVRQTGSQKHPCSSETEMSTLSQVIHAVLQNEQWIREREVMIRYDGHTIPWSTKTDEVPSCDP